MIVCNRCKKREAMVFKYIPQVLCKTCFKEILRKRIKQSISSFNFLDDELSRFASRMLKKDKRIKFLQGNFPKARSFDLNIPFYMEFLDAIFLYCLFYYPEKMRDLNEILSYSLPFLHVSFEELEVFSLDTSFDFQYDLLKRFDYDMEKEKLRMIFKEILEFSKSYKGTNEALIQSIIHLKNHNLLLAGNHQ
ncbi:MAG: hypothetical protein QXD62_03340 [Candidatus Woesearchaeota archaeon]